MNMKKTSLAAALLLAALLTGCGDTESSIAGSETTTAATETTTAAAETTTAAAETTTSPAETTIAAETVTSGAETTTSAAGEESSVLDYDAAMNAAKQSVLDFVGAGFKVTGIEELPHNPEAEVVFIVTVTDDAGNSYEYAANQNFCMTRDAYTAMITGENAGEEGENPLKDYVGDYASGRVQIEVSVNGSSGAEFRVSWSDSAAEFYEWTMSGNYTETDSAYFVAYSDCVVKDFVYSADGKIASEKTVSENGAGSFTIDKETHKLFWNDDDEPRAKEMSFTYIGIRE